MQVKKHMFFTEKSCYTLVEKGETELLAIIEGLSYA